MSEQRNIIIDNIDFSEALRYLGYGNSTQIGRAHV